MWQSFTNPWTPITYFKAQYFRESLISFKESLYVMKEINPLMPGGNKKVTNV